MQGVFPEPGFVETNGIRMAVYEQGEGPAVILLHGFPELAFSWRHQFPALAAAGYRAIAPDQRGYGRTSVPTGVDNYRIEQLRDDIEGLLDALHLESATFVGHDWGAMLLWHMAMLVPDRIDRLICLNVPHHPRPPADPVAIWRRRFGEDFYIVNFQDSGEADRTFAADTRHFFDVTMRRNVITRDRYDRLPDERKVVSLLRALRRDPLPGQPLLEVEEIDYYAAAFDRSGFTGAINWYRNFTHNWEILEGVDPRIDGFWRLTEGHPRQMSQ